jgi:hypothetical protein
MGQLAGLMEEVVWSLPAPSQEFMQGPHILVLPSKVILRWDSETETGTYEWASAEFTGVETVTFTAHSSCTPDQARAYDRLVKVDPSDMLANLRGAGPKCLQHFRIYFDEIGCLDVVAEDFIPPREQ